MKILENSRTEIRMKEQKMKKYRKMKRGNLS